LALRILTWLPYFYKICVPLPTSIYKSKNSVSSEMPASSCGEVDYCCEIKGY